MTSRTAKRDFRIPPVVTEIASRAKITGMNLVRFSGEVYAPAPPGRPADVRIELRGGSGLHVSEPRTFVGSFGADVAVVLQGESGTKLGMVSCDFAVTYLFDDAEFFAKLSEEDRDLFAAYNTSFQLWPHIREFVQSMAARMTLPTVVLPPFRPLEMIGPREAWKKRDP